MEFLLYPVVLLLCSGLSGTVDGLRSFPSALVLWQQRFELTTTESELVIYRWSSRRHFFQVLPLWQRTEKPAVEKWLYWFICALSIKLSSQLIFFFFLRRRRFRPSLLRVWKAGRKSLNRRTNTTQCCLWVVQRSAKGIFCSLLYCSLNASKCYCYCNPRLCKLNAN